MISIARVHLFVAFAFTVMADPVSSVAYAIESALGGLDGDLASLFPTMALVIGTITVVAATYHQLIRRFPGGGGGPEGLAAAFGEGFAFVSLGALLVDFTLTVAISCAAGASAIIAYEPELADARLPLAIGLAVLVAAGINFGHRGRVVFATATLAFLLTSLLVLGGGAREALSGTERGSGDALIAGASIGPVLLAMPLGMALATGVESPSNAIAQLGQLGERGRRIFGQLTIWLMVGIVGALTLGLAALAVGLGVGLPPEDSTLLAEVARAAVGDGARFATFQATSALLLLAAAGSAYLAASGLLRALATHGGGDAPLVPRPLGIRNRFFVPYWGVLLVLVLTSALIALSGGRDQELVHFYAVSVFASFLGALVGCARLSYRERRRAELSVNVLGTLLVAFVLGLNLTRLDGVIALAASAITSLYLWRVWVRRGRPSGVAGAGRPR
jgi:Amino acid permease